MNWRQEKSLEKSAQSSKTPKLKDSTRMTAGRDGTGRSEWCEWERENALDKILLVARQEKRGNSRVDFSLQTGTGKWRLFPKLEKTWRCTIIMSTPKKKRVICRWITAPSNDFYGVSFFVFLLHTLFTTELKHIMLAIQFTHSINYFTNCFFYLL